MSPSKKSQLEKGFVLMVEDSVAQAGQLRALLEAENLDVVHALNGADALDLLDLRPPTLIISDIMMPVMDGYEFCRRTKAVERFRHVPFMLLTSMAQPQDIFKGLESGADYYNVKPYDGPVLMERVRKILAESPKRSGAGPAESMDITHAGRKYSISADRSQILDLLLATFESTKRKNTELTRINQELSEALEANRTLRGLIPICGYCKQVRDDQGYWDQVEGYISKHTDAKFSHGICPDCLAKAMKELEGISKANGI